MPLMMMPMPALSFFVAFFADYRLLMLIAFAT